jgi:hypothetical protein
MNTAKEIICFLILFAPLVFEAIDDRKGDQNKQIDVLWRVLIGAAASAFVWLFTGHSLWSSAFMCFAIFFLLFDYTIAVILKRPDPFSYLSQTTGDIDRIKWWVRIGPWWRFAIRFFVFAIALILYF